MKSINDIIEDVLEAEGGYINNPSDPGGETNFGITKSVAAAHGHTGDMKDFPISLARAIYYDDYVVKPGFDKVYLLSPQISAELVDTGVNMGSRVAAELLQTALNGLSNNGALYVKLKVDGAIGGGTLLALKSYLRARGDKATSVMLKALNCLQGSRYLTLGQSNPKLETFMFGWFDNRVNL